MGELKNRHFECIKEDNSEEEKEKQWQRSKIVFDQFYDYQKKKGLNEKTAGRRTEKAAFFIMNYLFVYDDIMNILEVSEDTIRKFLGNWYIRKFWNPSFKGIKSFLIAISSFYTFLKDKGFISKGQLDEIKDVCKDKAWFEMRLRTYFEAQGDDFMIGYKNTIMIGEFLVLEAPNKKCSSVKPSTMIGCRYLRFRPKRFYYGVICPEIT